ncbi:hypothetical protein BBH99_02310 [Chryseobacterium contaminans]|uniref:Uncharacterized conserved protein n=1 Tax=Chryseobacterium contaminans TaxID=1423959 RepID=A0A1M7DHR8_9FLAO|nr:DUF2290 domain-containing protein [Chryseobacterium contaminans]OCA77784.1 hypothetical protein BBH99_02310 [Chryseobacterium contaminans]SHL79054.1 Uncharacterized conserved protein [Chryseobacterium contaminans]
MSKQQFFIEISKLTSILIELGLSSEQHFPSEVDNYLYISGNFDHSIALKNIDYKEIYNVMIEQKNFNCKLLDGAIIQLMYSFNVNNDLIKHRLCYFPSPYLLAYDEYSELYEDDSLYSDMLMKNILPVPIRFDYESDVEKFQDVSHPFSHLTLGQHKNCRIPLSQPLTPWCFVSFIVRNFYNSLYSKFLEKYGEVYINHFERCITKNEENILHMNLKQI